MVYKVKKIKDEQEISSCNEFLVNNFLWTCKVTPKTTGRMGYIKNSGLYIQMVCFEDNPLRTYKNHMEPVCKDSAMEAFFAFPHREKDNVDNFIPYNDCLYFNFEINANGAMYAKYGWGRKGRNAFTKEEIKSCKCKTEIKEGFWTVSFIVREDLLKKVYKIENLENINSFWCNFYKISEDENIEHYAALSPIISVKPNFHLPEFFAKAILI